MFSKMNLAAEFLRNFWNDLPRNGNCQKVAHFFWRTSKTGTPACEFWISEGYRISGCANGVDQLRLDVVHAGQTVSAGRVLFSRHADFFLPRIHTDGHGWICFFSFLNPCESVFIRGSSFFLFLFLLHRPS
jgi:glycosidase